MPRRPGGLAGAQFPGGVDDDLDPLGLDPEFLDRHLQGDGVNALAHLGPAMPDLDRAIGLEANHRLGPLLEAVAETRVLHPQTQPHGLALGPGLVVVRFDRFKTDRARPCIRHP